jgi:phytoene synthase
MGVLLDPHRPGCLLLNRINKSQHLSGAHHLTVVPPRSKAGAMASFDLAGSLHELPVAERLALSYAPRRWRGDVLAIWLLDQRLAAILRGRNEVLIAQIKLAWWRDRLGEDPANWPKGEPLLDLLRAVHIAPADLQPLVNGWERLLGEDLNASDVREFADGRAAAWQALADVADAAEAASDASQAAREVSYFDLAVHLSNDDEAQAAQKLAAACKWHRPRLPRALRPLAVIHALSRRALERGQGDLLDGPGSAMLALRIGLFGR